MVNLGAKAIVNVERGDRIRLLTPGGGGYGDSSKGDPRGVPVVEERFSAPRLTGGSIAQYRAMQESA